MRCTSNLWRWFYGHAAKSSCSCSFLYDSSRNYQGIYLSTTASGFRPAFRFGRRTGELRVSTAARSLEESSLVRTMEKDGIGATRRQADYTVNENLQRCYGNSTDPPAGIPLTEARRLAAFSITDSFVQFICRTHLIEGWRRIIEPQSPGRIQIRGG